MASEVTFFTTATENHHRIYAVEDCNHAIPVIKDQVTVFYPYCEHCKFFLQHHFGYLSSVSHSERPERTSIALPVSHSDEADVEAGVHPFCRSFAPEDLTHHYSLYTYPEMEDGGKTTVQWPVDVDADTFFNY